MAEINSFLCYRSYLEATELLPEDKQWAFFKAVCIYALDAIDPKFTDQNMKLAFTLMKANIDSCNKRYVASVENGKLGGAPKGNFNAKKKNNLPKNDTVKKTTSFVSESPSNPHDSKKNGTSKQPKTTQNNLNVNDNVNVNGNYHLLRKDVSEDGALSAPPPPHNEKEKEKFLMGDEWYEYYIAPNGEKRVRKSE